MATYKLYDHPLRNKMISRLCIEIYNVEKIPKDISHKLCFVSYQEIIKPLVHMEYNKFKTPAAIGLKYGLSAQVIRGILGIKPSNSCTKSVRNQS